MEMQPTAIHPDDAEPTMYTSVNDQSTALSPAIINLIRPWKSPNAEV
jgi:hypothetical protein